MCAARLGRDDPSQDQNMQNPKMQQNSIVRSSRYKNGRVLCAARSGRDGKR